MTDTHSSIIERTRAQLDLGLMELADKLVSEKISDSLRSLEPPQPATPTISGTAAATHSARRIESRLMCTPVVVSVRG